MQEYDKILKLTEGDTVELANSFKDLLHKELVFGQTRWVCRYGTLSDGHEKLTPAQRYYQAIREMYVIAKNIKSQKAHAMRARADILDANKRLRRAWRESQKLRARADVMDAQQRLIDALVTIEDQLRMLDEYDKVRQELAPEVRAKYPEGIEQAEPDNWMAVAKYRLIKERTPGLDREHMFNIPLDPETKAKLGYENGRFDAIAPLLVADQAKCLELENEFNKTLIASQQKQLEPTG